MVTKANLAMKISAIRVATRSFLVYLPVKRVMRTYAIQPMPIPLEIE